MSERQTTVAQCDWVTLSDLRAARPGRMPHIQGLHAASVDDVRIGMTTGGSWRIELRRGVQRQVVFIDGSCAVTERRPDLETVNV